MRPYPFFLRFGLSIVLLAAFALPGCAKKSPQSGGSAAAPSGQVPSDEEARQFAESFEAAVKVGNLEAVNAAIDWDAILDRAMAGCDVPAETRQQFAAGVKNEINGPNGFAAGIVKQMKKGADYHLLHVHRQDGQQRALFRLHLTGVGLNYHDIVLVRQASGKVRGDDVFIFAAGEMLSDTFRRGLLPCAAEASKSLLEKLTQQESDYAKNIDKVNLFIRHARAGEGAQAMEIYNQFPNALKKDKNILIMRLAAARSLGNRQEDAAIRAFRSACPDDPALDLLMIDSYYIHKQYAKERASIDRLDRSVGGDPYLDILRASSFLAERDDKTAKEYFRKAVAADDTLVIAYFNLVTIALREKDFDETSRLLTVIREKFPRRLPDVRRGPLYAQYIKSPQYQAWRKTPKQP